MQWRERWQVVSELKQGKVCLVQSRTDGRRAVLKFVPQEMADPERSGNGSYEEFRVDVITEIVALLELNAIGANVPAVIDENLNWSAGDPSVAPFVVMEFVEGEELGEFAESHAVTAEQINSIAATIEAAHGIGITHLDLSPGHVIIRPDGTPVVIDWSRGRHANATRGPARSNGDDPWSQAAARDLAAVEALRQLTRKTATNSISPAVDGSGTGLI